MLTFILLLNLVIVACLGDIFLKMWKGKGLFHTINEYVNTGTPRTNKPAGEKNIEVEEQGR